MASENPHSAADENALASDHGDGDSVDLEEVDWIFDENTESAFGNLNQTPCDAESGKDAPLSVDDNAVDDVEIDLTLNPAACSLNPRQEYQEFVSEGNFGEQVESREDFAGQESNVVGNTVLTVHGGDQAANKGDSGQQQAANEIQTFARDEGLGGVGVSAVSQNNAIQGRGDEGSKRKRGRPLGKRDAVSRKKRGRAPDPPAVAAGVGQTGLINQVVPTVDSITDLEALRIVKDSCSFVASCVEKLAGVKSKTLFVHNVPDGCTYAELRFVGVAFGPITDAEIHTGKEGTLAYVIYVESEGVSTAMESKKAIIRNQEITFHPALEFCQECYNKLKSLKISTFL
ncbi:hypothetical protein CASFOL_005004 [Castilleja foliolosa]|uniref:RRM domain-containing protein n=1 Tax=Castilleja foliolosa TaxID=1961234 RepID=A0ABD3E3A9_9LAMI